MTKKIIVFSIVTVLIVGITAAAVAAPGFGVGYDKTLMNQMDLTDEQYSRFQELHREHYIKRQNIMDQLRNINYDLRDMYFEKNPDDKAIETLQNKADLLREQAFQLREDQYREVEKILTDEQQKRLIELRGPGLGRGIGFGRNNCREGFGRGFCHGRGYL